MSFVELAFVDLCCREETTPHDNVPGQFYLTLRRSEKRHNDVYRGSWNRLPFTPISNDTGCLRIRSTC